MRLPIRPFVLLAMLFLVPLTMAPPVSAAVEEDDAGWESDEGESEEEAWAEDDSGEEAVADEEDSGEEALAEDAFAEDAEGGGEDELPPAEEEDVDDAEPGESTPPPPPSPPPPPPVESRISAGQDDEDRTIYKVVMNHEEQYSIWPADRENALGWKDAGKQGTKAECLAYIQEVWTDMRPLSLRKKMEEMARGEQ